MRNLIRNELFKLWKQTGIRVTLIIVLSLALIAPLFASAVTSISVVFTYGKESYYDDLIDTYGEWDDVQSKITVDYAKGCKQALSKIKERLASEDNWKIEFGQSELLDIYSVYLTMSFIADGKYDAEDVHQNSYIGQYTWNYVKYLDTEDYDKYTDYNIDFDDLKEKAPAVAEEFHNLYEETLKYYEELTPGDYYELYADIYRESLEEAERTYANDKDGGEIKRVKGLGADAARVSFSALEILKERGDSPLGWQFETFRFISEEANNIQYLIPQSEQDFENDYYLSSIYSSYEDYIKSNDREINQLLACVRMGYASIDNNTPLRQFARTPERETAAESMSFTMSIVNLLAIVLLATSICGEYSSGSVRLLLIRPHSRTKILLSKIAACGIIIGGIIIIELAASILICGAIGGFSDIFMPDVIYLSSGVYFVPSILRLLEIIGIGLISLLFTSSIALFMAVLTKRSVGSVAVAIISDTVLSIVAVAAASLSEIFPWIAKSPLIYYDMSVFLNDAVDYKFGFFESFNHLSLGMNFFIGLIYNLAIIAVLVALSLLIYRKHQVKS